MMTSASTVRVDCCAVDAVITSEYWVTSTEFGSTSSEHESCRQQLSVESGLDNLSRVSPDRHEDDRHVKANCWRMSVEDTAQSHCSGTPADDVVIDGLSPEAAVSKCSLWSGRVDCELDSSSSSDVGGSWTSTEQMAVLCMEQVRDDDDAGAMAVGVAGAGSGGVDCRQDGDEDAAVEEEGLVADDNNNDVATDSERHLTSTDDVRVLVVDTDCVTSLVPDGGYGWMIVLVSFLCASVVDGLCSVFGVLLPDLVIYFDQSSSTVAMAGSLLAGGFLLYGPVASVLINCFGCRATTIIGGLLSTMSLFCSPFSLNVTVFILVFGGLGGLGLSLLYLPAVVMVGYYFERRRGIAAGVACSGSGFGLLTLAPLAAFLVAEYTWKGALTVLAGVSLNCLVWGALMRPLPVPPSVTVIVDNEDAMTPTLEQSVESQNGCVDDDWMVHTAATTSSGKLSTDSNMASSCEAYRTPSHRRSDYLHRCVLQRCSSECAADDNGAVAGSGGFSTAQYRSCAELNCRTTTVCVTTTAIQPPSFFRVGRSRVTCGHLTTVGPLQRKDIFYGGSVVSLRSSAIPHSCLDVTPTDDHRKPVATAAKTRSDGDREGLSPLWVMLDVSLFRDCAFLVICASSVFVQLGYFVPVVFLTPYSQTIQLTTSDAAVVLSVIGISNMVGRAGAGALATVPKLNILHFNNLSLVVSGVSTALVTVLCINHASMLIYAVVFGLSIAVFVPLTTLFLVKYVGLNRLTNAYGLLSMVKGLATIAGPPIAGALLDATETYSSTFYFAGVMFVAAGLLFYTLPLTRRLNV